MTDKLEIHSHCKAFHFGHHLLIIIQRISGHFTFNIYVLVNVVLKLILRCVIAAQGEQSRGEDRGVSVIV